MTIPEIKYANSAGTTVILNDGAYFVNANDLRGFTWDYTAQNRPSGYGGRVVRFSRPVREKSIAIAVRGTETQFLARANALHALTEVDILSNAPGKLYIGDQYLLCFMSVSSDLSIFSYNGNFCEKTLKILAVEPYWCTETEQFFVAGGSTGLAGSKRYTGRYPYRYESSYSNSTLVNTHYAACPMIITVYGAATNPSISIAGHTYATTVTLGASETLVINQVNRTIYKYTSTGVASSLFDSRDKVNDIFQYCPAGNSAVSYTDINFKIVVVKQRSEPEWI